MISSGLAAWPGIANRSLQIATVSRLASSSVPGHAANPDEIIAWFAHRGLPYIAVTRGAQSILGWDRGRRFEIEVAPVAAVDTLGAGDVLHGAFCHFFALKPDFESALRRASEIATLSCQSLGARAWAAEAGKPAFALQ